jgi:hypothetical protein
MSLDGLRAWIGEVERKLGARTRVFLVLAVLALGAAGAAIYLAVDARESSVSEGDVQELQQQLEAQIGGGGGATGASTVQLESELDALRAQVEGLSGKDGGTGSGSGSGAGGASGSNRGAKPETGASGGVTPEGAGGVASDDGGNGSLQELLEAAKKKSQQVEREQGAR